MKRILIFDDSTNSTHSRISALEREGFIVTYALDHHTVLGELSQGAPFNLAIVNVNCFLKEDSRSAVTTIWKLFNLPIVFISPDLAEPFFKEMEVIPNIGIVLANSDDRYFLATIRSAVCFLNHQSQLEFKENPFPPHDDIWPDDQLQFLNNLDRINRVILETGDLEQMLGGILNKILTVFGCDRANLSYPCNPEAKSREIMIERNNPAYPGLGSLNKSAPMDEQAVRLIQKALRSKRPVYLGPTNVQDPDHPGVNLGHQGMLTLALRPKIGDAWSFSIHQCSSSKQWSKKEKDLFVVFGQHLEKGLNSMLYLRGIKDNERKLAEASRMAKIGWWTTHVGSSQISLSPEFCEIYGLPYRKTISAENWGIFWGQVVFPEDQKRLTDMMRHAIDTTTHYETNIRIKRPDGAIKNLYVHGDVFMDEKGHSKIISGTAQDITELREAEVALESSNRELKILSSCNQVLVRTEDEQELLEKVCDIICKEAGYTLSWVGYVTDVEEKRVSPVAWAGSENDFFKDSKITQNDDRNNIEEIRSTLWNGKTVIINNLVTYPFKLNWRDTALQKGFRSAVIIPLLDEQKVLFGVICVFSDIINIFSANEVRLLEELGNDMAYGIISLRARKEREHALDHLNQSNEIIQVIIEPAPVAIVGMDLQGNVDLVWNPAAESMFGWKKEEVLGQLLPIAPARDAEVFKEFMDKVARAECLEGFIFGCQKRDGSEIIIEAYASPIYHSDGSLKGSLSVYMDITEKTRIEEALRESEERYRSMFQQSPLGIFQSDLRGELLEVNPAMMNMLGYTEDAIDTATTQEISQTMFFTEAERNEVFSKAIKEESSQHQSRLKRKDESEFLVNIYLKTIYGSEKQPLWFEGIIEDVTERRRHEQLIIQTEKMMSLGGLAAGIAHEINNPLGAILMGAYNIKKRLDPTVAKNMTTASDFNINLTHLQAYLKERDIYKNLDHIMESGKRASNIIANMLQFSRKSETQKSFHRLSGIIEKTITLAGNDYDLKKKYDFRKIDIHQEYGPKADTIEICCVETEIEQVLLNLLKNASQALREAQTLSPKIVIRLSVTEETAHLEVEDNGPGLKESVQKKIFEPFFTTKPVGQGTGLGLSVSYAIVSKNHGGTMVVESAVNQGTKIIIDLPLNSHSENDELSL